MLVSKHLIKRVFAVLAFLQPGSTISIMQTSVPLRPEAPGAAFLELILATPVLSGKHLQDFPGSPLSSRPSPLPSTPTLAFKMAPSVTWGFIPQEVSPWPVSPAARTPCGSPSQCPAKALPSPLASQPADPVFSGPPCLRGPHAGCVYFLRQPLIAAFGKVRKITRHSRDFCLLLFF